MGPERLVACVLGLNQYPSAFPLGLNQYPRRSSDRPDYLTQRFSDQLRLRLYRVKPVLPAPHPTVSLVSFEATAAAFLSRGYV